MKRCLLLVCSLVMLTSIANARRLKVYSYPKSIAPGQLAMIVIENPNPDEPKSQSRCTAEKLLSWVKSDIPILRIEQNGKQIWTSIGSYQTIGDSAIATFMVPVAMQPGNATLYLVNDRDPSLPYPFTIQTAGDVKLTGIQGAYISPLKQFRVIGSGFVPGDAIDQSAVKKELEDNIGLSKMPADEQFRRVNKRMGIEWDKATQANFLYVQQGDKTIRIYPEQCSITPQGLALDFTAPPDIKPGPVQLALAVKTNGQETTRSQPLTVTVQ